MIRKQKYIQHIMKENLSRVVERFIRTLKNKSQKQMTSILKNVYIAKLDKIVNKYSNTYHITIKLKPPDVTDNTRIDSAKKH